MNFTKYLDHRLFTIDNDKNNLYRAIRPEDEWMLSIIEIEKDTFINFSKTDHKIIVGGLNCNVVKIPKLPFQIRIQELTSRQSLEVIKFLINSVISCKKHDCTIYDIHEGNILWWNKPIFIDLDAISVWNHSNCALSFVRICYLMYKYVFKRDIKSHEDACFEMLKTQGGWAAEQINRRFDDILLWNEFKNIVDSIKLPEHNKSLWSDDYAVSSAEELKNNPKIKKVIDMVPDGESMLDIGCNKGYMSYYFNKKFKYKLGFDNDESCIDKIKPNENSNFACFGIDNFKKIEPIPINERFHADVVLALAVVHHFESIGLTIDYIANTISKLSKKHILIEDITNYEEYDKIFIKNGFSIVNRIESYPAKRMLTLWKK